MDNGVPTDLFTALTPERVLDAVEQAGFETNPVCYPLNSFENRVYEVELDDEERSRLVAKFYRPGRWTRDQILEEHAFMAAAQAAEIPLCTVRPFPDGETVHTIDGIHYCLYPRFGGRAPEELTPALAERLGMLIARLHNAADGLESAHRRTLDAETFGWSCLDLLEESDAVHPDVRSAWFDVATQLVRRAEEALDGVPTQLVHGDFHMGNLLVRDTAIHVLDFDDCAFAPPVQDLWLVLPGRGPATEPLLGKMIAGYERFRAFDRSTLALIEPLRALRMIHFAAWLARRWHDPVFPRTWPQFTTLEHWSSELQALRECLACAQARPAESTPAEASSEAPELTNADFFWDWEG